MMTLLYIGPGLGIGTIAIVIIVLLIVLVSVFLIILTPLKKLYRKLTNKPSTPETTIEDS